MQYRLLTVDDERMSGVVSALKTHDTLCVIRQPINNLSLAFITPLGTNYYDVISHYQAFNN
jgi:hypothetical protein